MRELYNDPSKLGWAEFVFGEMIFEGSLKPALAIQLLKPFGGGDGLRHGFVNAFKHWGSAWSI
jgi:hypothetical protein